MSTSFIEQKSRFKLWNPDKSFDVLRAELLLLGAFSIVEWDTKSGRWVTDFTTPQVNAILFELRNE